MRDAAIDSADPACCRARAGPAAEAWCHTGEGVRHRAAMDIQPDPDCLAEARRFAERAIEGSGLDDRGRYELIVAVHEAVVNAIQHGSAGGGHVRVTSCRDERGLSFTIADPGQGFTLQPSTEPDLEARGRGLTLMFHAVDDISQHRRPGGKEIRMTKWLSRS